MNDIDVIEELIGKFKKNENGELVFCEHDGEEWIVDPYLGFDNVPLEVECKIFNVREYIRIQDSSKFPQSNSSYYNEIKMIAFEHWISKKNEN